MTQIDAAFDRMHTRLFAHYGQQAQLQGVDCLAILAHGVEATGEYGEVTGRVSVATLPAAKTPKLGNTLIVGSDSFVLDQLVKNDGHTAEYILRRA